MDYSKLYNFALESYSKLPYIFGKGKAFRPISLFLELTYRCNFRCNMCQFLGMLENPALKEKTKDELTADEIKALIDEVSPFGIIMFTGGEPLLRKDILELLGYACQKRKSYLVTNGILLEKPIADEMVRLGCSNIFSRGVASIGISIEGLRKTHDDIVKVPGAFDKVVENASYLLDARKRSGKKFPLIGLKCVMTKHNAGQLEDMYRLAEDIGADIFNAITLYNMPNTDRFELDFKIENDAPPDPITDIDIPLLKGQILKLVERSKVSPVQLRLTPPGITPEDIMAIYENRLDISNKACYSPWSTAAVSAYGEVFPCSNYSVGNIRDGASFMDIWNGERMAGFRKILKGKRIFKGCSACCSMVYEGSPSEY